VLLPLRGVPPELLNALRGRDPEPLTEPPDDEHPR
jgi:hypothetical protein